MLPKPRAGYITNTKIGESGTLLGNWYQSPVQSEAESWCVDFAGYKIINVNKSSRSRLTPTAIPAFPSPSLYVGDFNYQHVNWSYSTTSPDDENLNSWATTNNFALLHHPNGLASFLSHRWNVGINADMAFARVGHDNRLPFTCSRKVPAVTAPTASRNATEAQGSCLQRSRTIATLNNCHPDNWHLKQLPPTTTAT